MICFPFLRQFGAPDPWRFLPWSAPEVFLLALETAWRISRPFLRQFGAPDVFFPGAPSPACTWNACMAPSLVLFSVNLVNLPLTFSSLEPLLALETAWRPSRPFLRQFGAPDVFFPGAPACTWNCMAPLSSFSPSIWRPWRFLPWSAPCMLVLFLPWKNCMAPLSSFSPSIWRPAWRFLFPGRFPLEPCLHLKLHGAPLVLFSVNLAPLTFSSLEPLLVLETAWRPLSSFSPSIWRPWRFLPWSPCLHLATAWRLFNSSYFLPWI